MAVTIIVGKGFVPVPGHTLINGFPIDAVEVEEHTFDSDVTRFPVEKGSDISDNIVNQPRTLNLDCTVSDTPLPDMAAVRKNLTGSNDSVADLKPSDQAYALLLTMRDDREPVEIVTSLGTIVQMGIKNISVPRRAKDGGALKFRITLVNMVIVETSRASVKTVSTPGGQSQRSLGHRASSSSFDIDKFNNAIRNVDKSLDIQGFADGTYGVPGGSLKIVDGHIDQVPDDPDLDAQMKRNTEAMLKQSGAGDKPLSGRFDSAGNYLGPLD